MKWKTVRRTGVTVTAVLAGLAAAGRSSAHSYQPIRAQALHEHVAYLAADSLEGRGAGTRGIESAARYIGKEFATAGLVAAGDHDTFFQDFDATIGVRPSGRNALRIAGHEIPFENDWMPYGFSDTSTTRAAVVFAGYGITANDYKYDDYAGLDVKGKVVLVFLYEPGDTDSTSVFEGKARTVHSELYHKAKLARENGAVGLLAVIGPLASEPDELRKLKPDVGYYSAGIPCGQVRRTALQAALPSLDLAALQKQIDASGHPASRALQDVEVEWTVGLAKQRTKLHNVIGLVPGQDPHRAIVIGAHYDHLGWGGPSSLSPNVHEVHNGADDNASGTAALIEIGRWFAALDPKPAQTLLFIAFSGEEIGLAGSSYYVKHPVYPLSSVTTMLNMDMVGRLRDRKLIVYGTNSAQQFPALLDTLNAHEPRFDLKRQGDGFGPSDQTSFFKENVPVLHFFTGSHSDYHKPSDDTETLNYDGMAEVATFVAQVAASVMLQPLTFMAAKGPAPTGDTGGAGAFRSYFGSIPDYGQDENLDGVLLSGVHPDSPADKAGVRGKDVVVEMAGTKIHNIHDYVDVLNTHKPGSVVDVTVLRDGKRVALQATLGKHP